jgi:ribonuclease R
LSAATNEGGRAVAEATDPQGFTLLFGEKARVGLAHALPAGTIVELELRGPRVHAELARPGTGAAAMWKIAADCALDPCFSDAVMADVERLAREVPLDDPSLPDLTHLPFVTIDGPTSKDLDQAVHVARGEKGAAFVVRYALAAAADFVRPGSALFEEALRRGSSFYLPGFSVPMLPRSLSEGIISLNPGVLRRALVFETRLDTRGAILETTVTRGRVKSRKKLAWGDVQALWDAREKSPLAGSEMEESLFLLRDVGRLRVADAAARDVVRYHRTEVGVKIDDDGLGVSVFETVRDEVELANEQISLLVNSEGGRLLREHPSPAVQPIYRIHPGPDAERLATLRKLIDAVVDAHGLPDRPFRFREGESLAAYVAGLPQEGEHARVARALERQSLIVSLRSSYAREPGKHFGVGAEPYARFSAPMREIVGVFLHRQMNELLAGAKADDPDDVALRERVIESANRARDTQRRVNDLVGRVALDRLFERELGKPVPARRRFVSTVMGVSGAKVFVHLDEPGVDAKIYSFDVGKALGNAWLELDASGAILRVQKGGRLPPGTTIARVGDALSVVVMGRDGARDRWVILPDSMVK